MKGWWAFLIVYLPVLIGSPEVKAERTRQLGTDPVSVYL